MTIQWWRAWILFAMAGIVVKGDLSGAETRDNPKTALAIGSRLEPLVDDASRADNHGWYA